MSEMDEMEKLSFAIDALARIRNMTIFWVRTEADQKLKAVHKTAADALKELFE